VDNYLKATPAHKLGHKGMILRLKVKDAEAAKRAEFLKSPEGKAELAKQLEARPAWARIYGALATKVKKIERLLPEPSYEGARSARIEAGKALGLDGPARCVIATAGA